MDLEERIEGFGRVSRVGFAGRDIRCMETVGVAVEVGVGAEGRANCACTSAEVVGAVSIAGVVVAAELGTHILASCVVALSVDFGGCAAAAVFRAPDDCRVLLLDAPGELRKQPDDFDTRSLASSHEAQRRGTDSCWCAEQGQRLT